MAQVARSRSDRGVSLWVALVGAAVSCAVGAGAHALVTEGGVEVVRSDDMTVEQRPVEAKEAFGGWTPLVKGVKEGERVVISGISKLGPGVKVALVQPTSNDDINANHKSPIEE